MLEKNFKTPRSQEGEVSCLLEPGRAWGSSPGPAEPAVLNLPCSLHCFAKDQLTETKRKGPSYTVGDLGGSDAEESACSAGDLGSIPGLGRSSGGGNGNPLQYSSLENPMDRGAWWAPVHGVTKSWTQLSNFTLTFFIHNPTAACL